MKKALLFLLLLPLLSHAAPKTIPQLNEATTATGNAVVPMDTGTQSYRMSFTNLAKLMHSLFFPVVQTKAEDYQILATDSIVRGSGDRTFTMPDATTCSGKEFAVYKTDAVGTTITIAFQSGQTAGGASTLSLTEQYGVYRLKSNGTGFDIVGTPKVHDGAVTTAKIVDSNVTTAKIADGAVTQAKRAALGQQVSSTSSVGNTTSTTYVDVPNLTVTITTTGRMVMLMLVADGTNNACNLGSTATGGNSNVSFVRGSTRISEHTLNPNSVVAGPGGYNHVDVVAAGTYVYKVQFKAGTGGGATAFVNHAKLVAFELRVIWPLLFFIGAVAIGARRRFTPDSLEGRCEPWAIS
jgi:hypothetical protein